MAGRTTRGTRSTPEPVRRPIERWDEVPQFASEQEEQEFWDSHTLSERLLDEMERGGPDDLRGVPTRTPTRSRTIAVRFEEDVLRRMRALAARKQLGYQTLLKSFVLERLYEEEKREGMVA
jgi:predicted DNA binding CopG/RHH family protein